MVALTHGVEHVAADTDIIHTTVTNVGETHSLLRTNTLLYISSAVRCY